MAVVLVVVVGAATLTLWQGLWKLPGQSDGDTGTAMEMAIEGLEPNRQVGGANLVLREKRGNRRLVVVVGPMEALAIQADLNGVRSDRPMTYDLMGTLVKELGGQVNRVVVNNVNETTFYAKVIMNSEGRLVEVDSRPSDAIALALRAKAPIFAEASVLDKAGVVQTRN